VGEGAVGVDEKRQEVELKRVARKDALRGGGERFMGGMKLNKLCAVESKEKGSEGKRTAWGGGGKSAQKPGFPKGRKSGETRPWKNLAEASWGGGMS